MIVSVIIMAIILALTYIIKRKWQAIIGFIIDILILCFTIPDIINVFNPQTTDTTEQIGYIIGLSMFGPIIIILFLAMLGIGLAQAFTIKKYSPLA